MNGRDNLFANPATLQTAFLAFAVIVLLAVGVAILARARKLVREPEESRPEDVLEALRLAYDDGEIDEAEYRRAREVVERRDDGPGPGTGGPFVPRF